MARQLGCRLIDLLLALIIFMLVASLCVKAACPPAAGDSTTQVLDFVFIPEEQYDRNYSEITDEGTRPLGFLKGTVYYMDEGRPNPCVRVTSDNMIDRVEVLAETVPSNSRVCVRGGNQAAEDVCAVDGNINHCSESLNVKTIYFEFYCDSGCSQSDVNYWFRFTLSHGDPELWCASRPNEFPSSLGSPLPPSHKPNPVTTPSPGGVSPTAMTSLAAVILLALLASDMCIA
ncbi:PREDICTED: uncharacterized protein LOC106808792 [Priapulus caudatus]|uniref:Uncharacterized protein LOC106808792 n=1 Tax=Priapulus caudatus TaxID=37621 RepID=A0ABM1E4K9_PRICU|nr:PREDICTED: uncharacterized protein LOC106808792 [Priapulus caudatus]